MAGRESTIFSIPATDSFEAAPARHTVVFPYLLERSIYQKRIDAGHELEEKQAGTSRRKQCQTPQGEAESRDSPFTATSLVP